MYNYYRIGEMFMQIGIIGCGLMGGSFAKAFKAIGHTIYGYDIDPNTIRYAIEHGIIDSGSTFASDVLPHSHVVFICLNPVDAIKFIKDNINLFAFHTIITDIAGIKSELYQEIKPILRDDLDFILGHPIAGRERKGITHSDPSIFKGANYALCPVESNKKAHIEVIEELIQNIGFGHIEHVTVEKHDTLIAFTSQLTHLIALAIVNATSADPQMKHMIGDSYKDLTRIAMINETLWSELFLKNKDALLHAMDSFISELDRFKKALLDNDDATIKHLMKQATKKRSKL